MRPAHSPTPDPSDRPDALPQGAVRGRAAGLNPANRFEPIHLHVLSEHLEEQAREHPSGVQVRTQLFDDDSRSVLNPVDSPDLPMRWTFNPYRGCEHGCIYCYARPTHETLGFSCGLDFETKIMVKRDAPALLRREMMRPSWKGESIMVSGVTDPYQPTEARLGLMRACLEVFAEFRQPIGIVTKNHLVTRDIDLLSEMAKHNAASVAISLTTLDPALASKMEPRASAPRDRLRAMQELAAAGIPVAVMTAPVIPGLTDHEIPSLLKAASEAGATSAAWVLLRLPHQVKALFVEWLERHFPDRAPRVLANIREARAGRLNDPAFGSRMRGEGERAEQIARAFALFKRRYRLDGHGSALSSAAFRRPIREGSQFALFGEPGDA